MREKDSQKHINDLCDDYRKALLQDRSFDLKTCVAAVSRDDQTLLLAALIHLERELLSPERLVGRQSDWCSMLPEFKSRIDACFAIDREAGVQETDPAETIAPAAMNAAAQIHHADKTEFVSESHDQITRDPKSSAVDRIKQVGPYKLQQQIGEGGMGSVWLAEQSHPVRRQVALKIIRAGLDSQEVIARFEAERQALAMMDHPSIARILDAGTTAQGQPYFAMEWVKGLPLTEYCDAHKLSLDARLKLFAKVCDAVQHAHQKGIIHRDLKPSNILVAEYDGQPLPKVIDFGLAKALEPTTRLTDKSLFTEFGQILGTLKYMSPEQAALDSLDIDTRSDIYSLGVILYELLTGSTPLESDTLKGQAILKVLELIREHDSPRPSSRLSTFRGDASTVITQRRQTDVRRLRQILAGDLDWIVMKALDKDRALRYDSASGFADDLHRYLNNEPVAARPPSLRYRLRKFTRKNLALVVTSAIVGFAVLLAIIGTGWGFWEASRQAALLRKEAEISNRHLTFAREGNEILASVFSGLDPNQEHGSVSDFRAMLLKNLGQVIVQLEMNSIGNELEAAHLKSTLASSLVGLGDYQQAQVLLDQAIPILQSQAGIEDRETLVAQSYKALCLRGMGQLPAAQQLFEEIATIRENKYGETDPETWKNWNNLAATHQELGNGIEAQKIFERLLEVRLETLGESHPDTLNSMNNLAAVYQHLGREQESQDLLQQVLISRISVLGENHPDTLLSHLNLGTGLMNRGSFQKAQKELEDTLLQCRSFLGDDHRLTIATMQQLGMAYLRLKNVRAALPILKDTYQLAERRFGRNHPTTFDALRSLGRLHEAINQLEKATEIYEDCMDIAIAIFPKLHPVTLSIKTDVADLYRVEGRIHESIDLYREVAQHAPEVLGSNSPGTLGLLGNFAIALQLDGQVELAIEQYKIVLARQTEVLGPDHQDTLSTQSNLGWAYQEIGDWENAIDCYRSAAVELEKLRFPDEISVHIIANLTNALDHDGQIELALKWRQRWLDYHLDEFGRTDKQYINELERFGSPELTGHSWPAVESELRVRLDQLRKDQTNRLLEAAVESLLGVALSNQGESLSAEDAFISSLNMIDQHVEKTERGYQLQMAELLERIIDFYALQGNEAAVDDYQAKLQMHLEQMTP